MPDANTARHASHEKYTGPRLPFEGFGPEEFELIPRPEEPASEPGSAGRLQTARFWGARAAWLGLAAVLAFGSAGVVAAMSPPGPENREELTYGADRELSARLDDAVPELSALNAQVTDLGEQARKLLSSLSRVDQAGLDEAYQGGAAALTEIDRLSASLSDRMTCDPRTPELTTERERVYSAVLVGEWRQLCLALDSVEPLREGWNSMADGSRVAMSVASGISEHDRLAEEALQLATQGRYPEALAKLDEAKAALSEPRRIAANLAAVGQDVSTLNEWLERIDAMDLALAILWQQMIDSGGRITAQVTAALKSVSEAQALLPGSDAILSVVLYELAGNLLARGIPIEQAKGQLGAALAALVEVPAS